MDLPSFKKRLTFTRYEKIAKFKLGHSFHQLNSIILHQIFTRFYVIYWGSISLWSMEYEHCPSIIAHGEMVKFDVLLSLLAFLQYEFSLSLYNDILGNFWKHRRIIFVWNRYNLQIFGQFFIECGWCSLCWSLPCWMVKPWRFSL